MKDISYPKKTYSNILESVNKQSNKNNKSEEQNNCLPSFLINSLDDFENEESNHFNNEEKFPSNEHTIDKNELKNEQKNINNNFFDNNQNEWKKNNFKNKFN